jgi:hypothetical protein
MLGSEHPRDAEVHHLDGARLGHHHVGGLQIAVDDARAVRVGERIEHLHAEMGGLRRVDRPDPLGQVVQGLAPHVLHDHQQLVLLAMELVDGGDAGMAQASQRHRFGAEAFEHVRVGDIRVQDLDGDLAVEGLVLGQVDGPHAAAADSLENPVLADSSAHHDAEPEDV